MGLASRLSFAAACTALIGCLSAVPPSHREIRVVGSDTMLELNRRLAEGFMRGHPGDRVRVEGGGSGAGVEGLLAGEAEVAAVSRALSAEEIAGLHGRFGTLGVRFLIARDALSVYVNPQNPVAELDLEQLRGLFSGAITEWSQVGGAAESVVVVVRPPTSGTHRFFRDHVLLGGTYAAAAMTEATTAAVLQAVGAQRGAVGYGGLAYRMDSVSQVAIAGIEPTAENVRRDRYPLTRYLAFYTAAPPAGLARRFIDWCLGEEGQRVVDEVGYVPLWERRRG